MTLSDVVIIGASGGTGAYGFHMDTTTPYHLAVGAMRVSSCDVGVFLIGGQNNYRGQLWGPFNCHANSASGLRFGGNSQQNLRLAAITSWRNTSNGIIFSATQNLASVYFEGDVHLFGNTGTNLEIGSSQSDIRDVRFLGTLTCSGDSTFATTIGIQGSNDHGGLSFQRVVLGVATGIYTTHSTADISINGSGAVQWDLGRAQLGSATEFDGWPVTTYPIDSYISLMRKDESTGVHQTQTPLGTIARETGTVDVTPGLKLRPTWRRPTPGGSRAPRAGQAAATWSRC